MTVNWAKELNINIRDLKEESFLHPRRATEQRAHRKKAEEYWATRWSTSNLQASVEEAKLDRDGKGNL